MTELHNRSLKELHHMFVSREITVQDLTKTTFERIKKTELEVKTLITLDEEKALEQTEALDERGIDESNVLAGIPVGIKDSIVTKDILTTTAFKILYNFGPIYDAMVMDKIYQTGMTPVGKLNIDEFTMGGSTGASYFKKTRNAWGPARVPSSPPDGSAAAVAAGRIPVSLGSDTGGSIRQPAAFNDIVGMKSTYGRVSHLGLIAFASSLDQIEPMTRMMRDSILTLTAVSGYDEKDGTSSGVSVLDFAERLTGDIRGVKVTLPKEYLGEGVAPGIKGAVLKTVETFRSLGTVMEEVSLSYSKYGVAICYIIISSKASSNLQRFDGIRYGYRSENVKSLDDVHVNSHSEGFDEEVRRRIMLGAFSLGTGYYNTYFKREGQVRTLIKRDFEKAFADCDLITGPPSPTIAFGTGENINDPITMYMSDILTIPINLAGLPGMSVPAGLSEGLPVGLQIIGNYFDGKTMYQTAYALEQITEFHKQQPTILGGEDE